MPILASIVKSKISMEVPLINNLNSLITVNYDAERGYMEAANDVSSPRLKKWFSDFAKQRYDFGHEIKSEIEKLGGDIDKGTSLKADVHRMWMDLKSAIVSNDEEAILNEVIRGEQDGLERYNHVIAQPGIPDSIRTIVGNQKMSIQHAISKIEALSNDFVAS